jgi:hypothetical protein
VFNPSPERLHALLLSLYLFLHILKDGNVVDMTPLFLHRKFLGGVVYVLSLSSRPSNPGIKKKSSLGPWCAPAPFQRRGENADALFLALFPAQHIKSRS